MRDPEAGLERRVARIVEVEAYLGEEDLASHARFGPTARNRVMFGRPGIAYVYLVYGMHHMLNVVTGPPGQAGALLIRAVEPLAGQAAMRAARAAAAHRPRRDAQRAARETARLPSVPDHRLASGPALVAACFGLDRSLTGTDLLDLSSSVRIETGPAREPAVRIATSERIGVGYAGTWAGHPWRFTIADHRSLSGRPARGARTVIARADQAPNDAPAR